MKTGMAAIALLAMATITGPTFAGERTSLGAIPILPEVKDLDAPAGGKYGIAGLKVVEQDTHSRSFLEISAASAQGFCIVRRDDGFDLQTDTTDTGNAELWHLVEHETTATLERTRFQVAPHLVNVWARSKSSVELKALGRDLGITAWGLREANGDVTVLARRTTFGHEAGADTPAAVTSSACSFGATRIRAPALKSGGGAAQLVGRLPAVGEGRARVEPGFIIDVSAVKVSRDPEPVIGVRFRKTE